MSVCRTSLSEPTRAGRPNPESKTDLEVREDARKGTHIQGAVEVAVARGLELRGSASRGIGWLVGSQRLGERHCALGRLVSQQSARA